GPLRDDMTGSRVGELEGCAVRGFDVGERSQPWVVRVVLGRGGVAARACRYRALWMGSIQPITLVRPVRPGACGVRVRADRRIEFADLAAPVRQVQPVADHSGGGSVGAGGRRAKRGTFPYGPSP